MVDAASLPPRFNNPLRQPNLDFDTILVSWFFLLGHADNGFNIPQWMDTGGLREPPQKKRFERLRYKSQGGALSQATVGVAYVSSQHHNTRVLPTVR
jgi:hypothetical protein